MTTINIPVFDGTNYEHWSLKMKTYLKAIELWDVVEKGTVQQQEPPLEESYYFVQGSYASSSSSPPYHDYYSKYMETQDKTVLYVLQNGVSREIFPWIAYAKSSKEAWDLLLVRSIGGPMFQANKLDDLEKEFNDMKMRGDDTIHGFSERVMELVFRMRSSCGWEVGDKEVVKKIVSSLPSRFDNVVVEEVVERLSISEVIDYLLAHEYNMRLANQESLEVSTLQEEVKRLNSLTKNTQREKESSMDKEVDVMLLVAFCSIVMCVCWFIAFKDMMSL